MSTPFHQRLYLRIWFAVVATIAIVAAVAGWLGNQEVERERAQRPVREITIKSSSGEVLGQARARPNVVPGQAAEFQVAMNDGSTLVVQFSRAPGGPGGPAGFGGGPRGQGLGPGAEPGRGQGGPGAGPPGPPQRPPLQPRFPFSFVWLLVVLAVAVGIGAYPIARRLTRRLETVQSGVQRWGEGELSFRLPEEGKDEVGYLARQFNQSAERIEQLMDSQKMLLSSQRSLLANASHELRSPLTRIRMGLELMDPHAPPLRGSLPQHGAESDASLGLGANLPRGGPSANSPVSPATGNAAVLAEVSRSIHELDQLIEEILLASRLDAQEADMGTVEPLDLLALAAEEGARVQADLEAAPSSPVQTDWMVQGVSKLLRRALRNLLENARRYAKQKVSLQLVREGKQLVVRVCDDGPGVPAAYQARIFEAFFRLPGASERDGGAGLGLALVKSIATRHGGSVVCSNNRTGGACFELRLPA